MSYGERVVNHLVNRREDYGKENRVHRRLLNFPIAGDDATSLFRAFVVVEDLGLDGAGLLGKNDSRGPSPPSVCTGAGSRRGCVARIAFESGDSPGFSFEA